MANNEDGGQGELPPAAPPAPPAKEKVISISKYLDAAFPDMVKIQRGVFQIKHKAEFHTPSEWDKLVKPELTRRIS